MYTRETARDAGIKVSKETFGFTSESMSRSASEGAFSTYSKLNTFTAAGKIIEEKIISMELGRANDVHSPVDRFRAESISTA